MKLSFSLGTLRLLFFILKSLDTPVRFVCLHHVGITYPQAQNRSAHIESFPRHCCRSTVIMYITLVSADWLVQRVRLTANATVTAKARDTECQRIRPCVEAEKMTGHLTSLTGSLLAMQLLNHARSPVRTSCRLEQRHKRSSC